MVKVKRLSELEPAAFGTRSTANAEKSMVELQGLIDQTFAEIQGQDLCGMFVQPALTITDPNGLMQSVFATIEDKPGTNIQFEAFLALLGSQEASPPILVLGNVGIGKSTLLHHSFECRLKDKPVFPIFVDFLNVNDDSSQISRYVAAEVDRALTGRLESESSHNVDEEVYSFCEPARKVQFENLTREDPGLGRELKWKAMERLRENKADWNRARIHYLQNKLHVTVCLIFDNVDHHWTPGYIQNVITEAMAQAHQNQCRLVVTLRNYNYGAAHERRAYAAQPFTIVLLSKPDLQHLFRRRIETALRKSSTRNFTHFMLSNGMRMTADTYLSLLKLKLVSLMNPQVSDLLSGIAGANFRKLLLCTRYIFSMRTLMAPEEMLRSPLTVYDALECILRPAGHRFYKPPEMSNESVIVNLFEDESPGQPGNNLIRVRVLQAIHRYTKRAFHHDILRDMESLGYSNQRVESVLDMFHSLGLVDPGDNSRILQSIDATHYCHELTYCGRYYLEKLLYEYRYALAVREATFFSETQYQAIIGSSVESEHVLEQRAAHIEAFDELIAEEERQEMRRCQDPGLLQGTFYRIAERMKSEHKDAIRRLRTAQDKRLQDTSQHDSQRGIP